MAKIITFIGVGLIALALTSVVLLSAQLYGVVEEVKCPYCGSIYVWTPIKTRSENFLWKCLTCGKSWYKTYSEAAYHRWLERTPIIVKEVALRYIAEKHPDARQLLEKPLKWTVDYMSVKGARFKADGWVIEVQRIEQGFKVMVDFSVSRIPGYIGIPHRIVWEGLVTLSGEVVEYSYGHYY